MIERPREAATTHSKAAAGEDSSSPGERSPDKKRHDDVREKMMDKTLADSFPTSDPPSSIPDPSEEDSFAA